VYVKPQHTGQTPKRLAYDLTGCLTINVANDSATSAAASKVVSPGLSYMGATSTTKAHQ
jgi:hypothetical protein